jgi:hypothetical protein
MKKDIEYPKVTDIAIAVVKEDADGEDGWSVYLINLKDIEITGVLVSSKGYGKVDGEDVKTSVLRHFIDNMPAKSVAKVEPIMENVFHLNNEYWVSFYVGELIHDKKFIFLPGTIDEAYFTNVPVLNKRGVLIA